MQIQRLSSFVLALSILALLAACTEDEESCSNRISADFDREATAASKSGNHEYALIARESDLTALVIYRDDDRSICDDVTAGPDLERK